jgi:hypothetical protein
MKAPIAQRRIIGARGIPGRQQPRRGKGPLRRPLALLYRQSGKAASAAPAALRAADGRAVTLAPRLQVALHLSLTFNEQHHAGPVFVAPATVAAAAASTGLTGQDRLFVTHFANRPTVTPAGARERQPSSDPVANRNPATAAPRGNRRRVAAAAVKAHASPSQPTSAKGRSAASPGPHDGANDFIADTRTAMRTPPADLHHGEPISGRAAQPVGTIEAASGPGQPTSRARRLPSVMAFANPPGRVAPPRAADRLAGVSGIPAAPLYLAERQSGRATGPAAFATAWAPPPLDFRSIAPPPAPLHAEPRPAPAPAPPAPTIEVGAISRDVISRIEQRLRVERERRGRS